MSSLCEAVTLIITPPPWLLECVKAAFALLCVFKLFEKIRSRQCSERETKTPTDGGRWLLIALFFVRVVTRKTRLKNKELLVWFESECIEVEIH